MSQVVPYDHAWPAQFEAERASLEVLLRPWLLGGVHHIGSTAVPGLAAKPIIDMIAGIEDLNTTRDAFGPLGLAGYAYRAHRPDAHLLEKPGCHLHLTVPGSDLWRERIAFRDALRNDAELRLEYERWKVEHSAPVGSAAAYTAPKTPFVARTLALYGINLKPDHIRLVKPGGRGLRA